MVIITINHLQQHPSIHTSVDENNNKAHTSGKQLPIFIGVRLGITEKTRSKVEKEIEMYYII